jgi:Recombination endonuclease VII
MNRREKNRLYYHENREKINEARRVERAANPEKHRAQKKAYYDKNKEEIKVRTREWGQKNRDKIRAYLLKQHYGITQEEYNIMWSAQAGKCEICTRTSTKPLCVDHNHRTSKNRGLLCSACNTAIGLLKEDVGILSKAAEYLKKYES